MTALATEVRPRSGFVRRMLDGHGWLGLAFAALIYLICLTGAVAVFAPELRQWEQPAPRVQTLTDAALTQVAAEAAARARAEGVTEAIQIFPPDEWTSRLGVRWVHRDGRDVRWYADSAGRLVQRAHTPWTDFVAGLHADLRLPGPWGEYVVGLIGVALLASIVSGVLAHPRILRDAFHLRLGGDKRVQDADVHNRIGVWALPFHFVVTLTGAFLGLAGLIVTGLAFAAYGGDTGRAVEAVLGPQAAVTGRPAPLPDFAAIRARVLDMTAGAEPRFIVVERFGTTGQLTQYDAAAPGHLAAAERYFFDAQDRFLRTAGGADGPVGMQLYAAVTPLHFGTFGGLAVKAAYLLLGLGLCWVTSTGVTIWLARRRARGRPAPGWERAWTAVVWGQPAALAISAVLAIGWSFDPLLAWSAATLATFAICAVAPTWRMLNRRSPTMP